MRRVVHLAGDDRDVMAVAEAALRSIGPTHARWVASVRRLHTERREYVRSLAPGDWSEPGVDAAHNGSEPSGDAWPEAHADAAPARDAPAFRARAAPLSTASGAQRPSQLTVVWWMLLSVAGGAATVGAIPMVPLQIAQDPGLIMTITPPAMLLAGALLVLTAATMPRTARSGTALGLALSSAIFAAGAIAISAPRWEALVAAGDRGSALAWLSGAIATVLGGCVLAWRAAPPRSRLFSEAKPAGQERREFATELVTRARRYARKVPSDEAVRERWRIELAELAGNVPLESIEQARSLGPWGWLVWAAYDGEIHLPGLLATSR